MKESDDRPGPRTIFRFAAVTALWIGLFLMVATTSADVDLWGHVRFGLDILEDWRIDATDPYSFTSDRRWINHEWLAEVAFAAAWAAAGASGLIAMKLAAAGGALWAVRLTLKLRGVGSQVQLVLLGLTLAGILPRLLHVRPQLFSVLLFSILVWVFARAEGGRRWTLALCPPLLALWTNLHGGWITGLGALGLWALADAWHRRREGARALDGLAWTAASGLATLLNPYGPGLWTFLAATVRFGREGIGEWGPIWTESTAFVVWILFAFLVAGAITSTGARSLGTRLVQPVFWGLASLRVARLDALFVLSVTGSLGPGIERFLGRGRAAGRPLPAGQRAAIAGVLLLIALAMPESRRSLTCISIHGRGWPEPAAVAFLHANDVSGRMLTYFNWGEYAIWHVPPAIKVSMDGRRETVYSDEMFTRHLRFYAGLDEGLAFAESLDADYAWLPTGLRGARALRDRGWMPVFEGPQSVILASPSAGINGHHVRPEAGPGPVTRCFPGP